MKFAKFTEFLQKLESTTSRNEMTVILAQLLKRAKREEVEKVCYLALGRLGPKFASIQFNLAVKMMIKALALAFAVSEGEVSRFFKKSGDLGDVAFKLKRKAQNSKLKTTTKNLKLSVLGVYSRLREIAEESGEGSVERKIEKMAKLLRELDPISGKYAVRITLEKLRLGFSDMTILDALSWMIAGDKSKREGIENAYNVRADAGEIVKKLKVKNPKLRIKRLIDDLKLVKPKIGTPIVPALCQRLPTAEEMVEKMHKVAVEPKFDGQRLQVHYWKEERKLKKKQVSAERHPAGVSIFTRNLDNVTHMFPDIVEALKKEVKAKRVILDGEAVGFDPKTGKLLPFQETIKRKRKYQVKEKIKEIPLRYYCFDLLYKEGKDFLGKPFSERRRALERILKKGNKTIILSPQIVTNDPQVIRRFHDEQIKKGLEGAVLKKWEAPYDPGRRGYTWVKFKSEKSKESGGLADTLDCVVMGYYRGEGKRAEFGIGKILVGVRESEKSDNLLTITKIGTGLSDEDWREMKRRCDRLRTKEKPKQYRVYKNLIPDFWCRSKIVVEVGADNITRSSVHIAKYSLRFPRLIRFRDDKGPEQVTTVKEVEKLYKMQK